MIPGTSPAGMPGQPAGMMPGPMPMAMPGAQPAGMMPGTMPMGMPGAMPMGMPGAMPMGMPGALPQNMPGPGQPYSWEALDEALARADPEIEKEELRLAKMRSRSLLAKKEQGTPIHTTLSQAWIGLTATSYMMFLGACFTPAWYYNPYGILLSPGFRGWGPLWSQGHRYETYVTKYMNACKEYGLLNTIGICASPLCIWYRTKCDIYRDIAMFSIVIAATVALGVLMAPIHLYWALRLTPRKIRNCLVLSVGLFGQEVFVVIVFTVAFQDMFETFNMISVYPLAPYGFGAYFVMIAMVLTAVAVALNTILFCQWPEPGDDSDTSEDSDLSDEAADAFSDND